MAKTGPKRKTFSGKVGRPPKAGAREPNGRLQRLYDEDSKAEKHRGAMVVVLAQPHRKGSVDQRRRWPIGRLILDERVSHSRYDPSTLERAAELYSKDYAELRWTLDSRRPYWTGGSNGQREAATADDRLSAEKAWTRATRALRDCGERVQKAVDFVVIDAHPDFDEATYAPWIILSLPMGLASLVEHYGLA